MLDPILWDFHTMSMEFAKKKPIKLWMTDGEWQQPQFSPLEEKWGSAHLMIASLEELDTYFASQQDYFQQKSHGNTKVKRGTSTQI